MGAQVTVGVENAGKWNSKGALDRPCLGQRGASGTYLLAKRIDHTRYPIVLMLFCFNSGSPRLHVMLLIVPL